MPEHTINILTRYASTYHAKTGKGKSMLKVSCTAGEKNAAEALLQKWYGGKGLTTLTDTGKQDGDWRIWTADVNAPAPSYKQDDTFMTDKSNPIKLSLSQIVEDLDLQMREEIDHSHVDDLKECLEELPPITVFLDAKDPSYKRTDDCYYIADGWHRYLAHKLSGKKEILAEVKRGDRTAALIQALGANSEHNALRRTNRDKRKAVQIAIKSYSTIFGGGKIKNVVIAESCKVTEGLVRKVRKEMDEKSHSANSGGDSTTEPLNQKPTTQLSFFDQLNTSFQPVAKGLEEIFNHSALIDETIPKADKIETLKGIEAKLKEAAQRAKDTREKFENQD